MQNLYREIGDRDWYFLSQIERGKDVPSIETLYLISNALEISIAELFKSHQPTKPLKYDTLTMKIISMVNDQKPEYKKKIAKILQHVIKK